MKRALFLVASMMILATMACEFSFSTANINNVRLANNEDANNTTTSFSPEDTVYVHFDLRNAPDDTTVSTIWYFTNADGEFEAYPESEELETSDAEVWFRFRPLGGFTPGQYKVDILLDGEREESVEFEVVAN